MPQFGAKKVSHSEVQANIICSVSSIGKHRVKSRTHFRGRFCFDIEMIIRQNIVRQRFVFSKIFSTWLGTASLFFLKNLTLEVFILEIGTAYDHPHTFYQFSRPIFAQPHAKMSLIAHKHYMTVWGCSKVY